MRSRVTSISFSAWLPSVRLATVLLVAVGFAATPAEAQLGKLKKIGADKIKDAAKEAAGVSKPDGTPAGATGPRVDYTITDERLSAMVEYLAPLVAEAEKQAEVRAVNRAYAVQRDSAASCFEKVTSGDVMPDMAGAMSPRAQVLSDKLAAYSDKATKASAAKNYRAAVANSDSAAVTALQHGALLFPSKCPAAPYKPVAMVNAEAAAMARAASGVAPSDNASGGGQVPSAMRAGMTTGQFGRIRERMAIWLLVQAGDLPPTTDKFTEEETALMTSKRDVLKRFGPLFNKGVMRWATWDDLTTW